jgi:hypothetical protein
VTFFNLPEVASLEINSVKGRFIADVPYLDRRGKCTWGLNDSKGAIVPSGVYCCIIRSKSSKKILKIIVTE